MTRLGARTQQYSGGLVIPDNTQEDASSSPTPPAPSSASHSLTTSASSYKTTSDDSKVMIPADTPKNKPLTTAEQYSTQSSDSNTVISSQQEDNTPQSSPDEIHIEYPSSDANEQTESFSDLHTDEPMSNDGNQPNESNYTANTEAGNIIINVSGGTCSITINTANSTSPTKQEKVANTQDSSSASLFLENILSSNDSENLSALQDKLDYMQKVLDAKRIMQDAQRKLTEGF